MKPHLALILAITVALGALPMATESSLAKGGGGGHGGGGGGHGGGGHFGGGHGGGGHFGGGHGGGHFGGGHGGGHFGGGHGGGHLAGSHGGGHLAGNHGGGHLAGGRGGGGHFGGARNAFGAPAGWNHFAGNGGAGQWGGWGGGWGGWVGPVFWPFIFGDIFSYALWPYDYYYPFWSYGTAYDYDYWPYNTYSGSSDPSNIYGYAGANGYSSNSNRAAQVSHDVTQSCGGFAPGVTNFPIDRIRRAINPTGPQITLLDDLAAASSKAGAILNASCPNEPPLTPLARLDALQGRLEATIKAIEIVRPALAALYDSLSDEQRQRLDAVGADESRQGRGIAGTGSNEPVTLTSVCSDQSASFTRLPVQRIEDVVKPTGQQQSALEALQQVSTKASEQLRASCPSQIPEKPNARLDATNARLNAMLQAVSNLRPALGTFYASLSDEQKAQFNNMGRGRAG
jgi:hypothetical protein